MLFNWEMKYIFFCVTCRATLTKKKKDLTKGPYIDR